MTGTVSPARQLDGAPRSRSATRSRARPSRSSAAPPTRTRSRASSPPSRTSTASRGSASAPPRASRPQAAPRPPLRARRAGQETSEDCRTSAIIYQFEIAVAFDSVPTPPTATPAPAVPRRAPPTSPQGQLAESPATQATQRPSRPARPRRPPTSCREREAEMKTTDRAVLIGFLAVGLLVGFYMMVLSPKREEASEARRRGRPLEAPDRRAGADWRRTPSRRARSSRSTTGAWSCSARPSPRTPTPPRCWSS